MGYNQREMEIHRQELNEFEATRTNYHRDCASKYTPSFLLCLNLLASLVRLLCMSQSCALSFSCATCRLRRIYALTPPII
jgi:hypothetical protein